MIDNSMGTYWQFGDKLSIVNDYRGELLGTVTFIEYNNADTDLCLVRDDRGQHFSIRRKNLKFKGENKMYNEFTVNTDKCHSPTIFNPATGGFISDKTIAEIVQSNLLKSPILSVKKNKKELDMVNKPNHYMLFPEKNVEVRDLMKVLANRLDGKYSPMFISDYIQMMQYLLRFDLKNGIEDLEKSQWYLNKLIKEE